MKTKKLSALLLTFTTVLTSAQIAIANPLSNDTDNENNFGYKHLDLSKFEQANPQKKSPRFKRSPGFAKEIQPLPAKFDGRTKYYKTPVKDQKSNGICWAFSTMALVEENLKKNTLWEYDMSEGDLGENNGFVKLSGGDPHFAAYAFNHWKGNSYEKDYPYESVRKGLISSGEILPHEAQTVTSSSMDKDQKITNMKNCVIKNGAIKVGVYWKKPYEKGNSYYYNGTEGTNHAITVIGWDDNYSKNNFANKPSNDGAWIIKNSWGPNVGENGYYYVSYDDTNINNEAFSITDIDLKSNYSNNYEAMCKTKLDNESALYTFKIANDNEALDFVTAHSVYNNDNFSVFVEEDYDKNGTNLILNKPFGQKSLQGAGHTRIVNKDGLNLTKGNTVAILIKANNNTYFSKIEPNDMYQKVFFNNINAVTRPKSDVKVSGITLDKSEVQLAPGEDLSLVSNVLPQDATYKKITWTTSNPDVATVDFFGRVTGVGNGEAVITASTREGNYTATTKVTVADKEINLDKPLKDAVLSSLNKSDAKIMSSDLFNLEKLTVTEPVSDIDTLKYCKELRQLTLKNSNNNFSNLNPIKNVSTLSNLTVEDTKISDLTPLEKLYNIENLSVKGSLNSIDAIKNLTYIKNLDLNSNNISNIEGIQSLSRVTTLNLGFNPITDLTPLKDSKQLENVILNNTKVTDASVLSNLKIGRGYLKSVNLDYTAVDENSMPCQLLKTRGVNLSIKKGNTLSNSTLNVDSLNNNGNYTINVSIPANSNASSYRLLENDLEIKTGTVPQNGLSFNLPVSSKVPGKYTYKVELSSPQGSTTSNSIIVNVEKETPAPISGAITVDNANNTGDYNLTVNIPSKSKATSYKLYENDVVIKEGKVTTDALNFTQAFKQKPIGTYSYKIETINSEDKTVSSVLTVTVSAQPEATPWTANTSYKTNDLVTYNGKTYKCVQGHTALAGWTPDVVSALWSLVK